MNIKGYKKCYCSGCFAEAEIFMLRNSKTKITDNTVGYCKKHYGNGDWLKRQKLFPMSKPFLRINRKHLIEFGNMGEER